MPEDVRRYFSLVSRRDQAEQQVKAATKAWDDFSGQAQDMLGKVTQTGGPIVARMPNGDTYVMYQDDGTPTVEKVQVINL